MPDLFMMRQHSGTYASSSPRGCSTSILATVTLPRRATKLHRATQCPRAQGNSAQPSTDLLTFDEVQQIAKNRGLQINVKTLGPLYKVVCRDAMGGSSWPGQGGGRPSGGGMGEEKGELLAVTTGFVIPPLGLMHCDTLQVFTKGKRGDEGQRVRGGPLGLGLLLGCAAFSWGYERGCTKAEILAINDDEYTHRRLVTYYRYFGFKPVRVVSGSKLRELPDMLVWGGAGTRMDADLPACLRRWTAAVRQKSTAGRREAVEE